MVDESDLSFIFFDKDVFELLEKFNYTDRFRFQFYLYNYIW